MDVREQSKLNLIEAIEAKIETATDRREPIEKQDLFRLFLKYGFPAKEGQRIYDEIRAQVKGRVSFLSPSLTLCTARCVM
jgi:hypothetical protein